MNMSDTPPAVPKPKTNGLAIASLALGILSVLLCGVGIVFAIPGLICGIMGMNRVKNSGGTEQGHGLALTGTVMSGVSLALLPVIGLLAAIAIPNFVKARQSSQRAACVSNLHSIDDAKATWALENRKTDGTEPADSDLFGPAKYLREKPTCPAGGSYSLGPVGERPTCTVPGHVIH
jgi:hypothetical protein